MVIAPAFFLGHGEFAVRATNLMCLRRAPQKLSIHTVQYQVSQLCVKSFICVFRGPVSSGVERKTLPVKRLCAGACAVSRRHQLTVENVGRAASFLLSVDALIC